MSTAIDVATKNSTDRPERKRTPSEETRRVVLDMIDQEVNQFITERSMARHKTKTQTKPQGIR